MCPQLQWGKTPNVKKIWDILEIPLSLCPVAWWHVKLEAATSLGPKVWCCWMQSRTYQHETFELAYSFHLCANLSLGFHCILDLQALPCFCFVQAWQQAMCQISCKLWTHYITQEKLHISRKFKELWKMASLWRWWEISNVFNWRIAGIGDIGENLKNCEE